MTTIGESVSRIRTIYKLVDEDTFITDKQIFKLLSKYAKAVIRRQDNEKKIMGMDGLFEFLPFMEVEEVSKIDAGCAGIEGNCTILRTKLELPKLVTGAKGPLIKNVLSIDGSKSFDRTTISAFIQIKNSVHYKYLKGFYYWLRDGYMYFPDMDDLEAVLIECLPEDSLDGYCTSKNLECTPMQERPFPLPDYLFAEIEQAVEQELLTTVKLPSDTGDDSQNIIR